MVTVKSRGCRISLTVSNPNDIALPTISVGALQTLIFSISNNWDNWFRKRITWTARVKKTPASEASFLTLKSIVSMCAYAVFPQHRLVCVPCKGSPLAQMRWCRTQTSNSLAYFVGHRLPALALKGTASNMFLLRHCRKSRRIHLSHHPPTNGK